MTGILAHLPPWLSFISEHRYLVLFLLGTFEGGNSTIIAGMLVAAGDLTFGRTLILLSLGEAINGTFWFIAGWYLGAKPLDWFVGRSGLRRQILDSVSHYFNRYSSVIILAAKMTLSLTNATLALAGTLKFSPRRFQALNIIGSVGWVLMLLGIGFFFGSGAFLVMHMAGRALKWLLLGAALLCALALTAVFSKTVLNRLLPYMERRQP